jgi:exonuclease VII large subunit
VIVLIRGGGDPADFDVFDQKSVIEAWAGKNAYKVLGLGHEGTGSTLLHFISDYAASTPSSVVTFLARQISEMNERKEATEGLRPSGKPCCMKSIAQL